MNKIGDLTNVASHCHIEVLGVTGTLLHDELKGHEIVSQVTFQPAITSMEIQPLSTAHGTSPAHGPQIPLNPNSSSSITIQPPLGNFDNAILK